MVCVPIAVADLEARTNKGRSLGRGRVGQSAGKLQRRGR